MDSNSQETLRRIEQNDATLTKLYIGSIYSDDRDGRFVSMSDDDFSRLGASIGEYPSATIEC